MQTKSKISVLIVDDESLARGRVRKMLEDYPHIEVLAECKNGTDAYQYLQNNKPDLVFLDIQMPEMTGLELVEVIGYKNFPSVIFVTAFDQHAVKAFELCAVDYLLKPFDKKRFAQAVTQATERIISNNKSVQQNILSNFLDKTKPPYVDRIFIKDGGLISIVETKDIFYIESSGNYVTIYTSNKSYLHRLTMKKLEEHLDHSKFIRVHRSFIVQINKIKSLNALKGGDYTIFLKNNRNITLSRRYKEKLEKYFTI